MNNILLDISWKYLLIIVITTARRYAVVTHGVTLGDAVISGLLSVCVRMCVFVGLFGSLEIIQSFTPDVHSVLEHISRTIMCRTDPEVHTQSNRGSWTGTQMLEYKHI